MAFDPIMEVIQNEGGFVNDPKDRGGATNYGITIGTLSKWLRRQATVEDVKNLTVPQAHEIYERIYFTGPRINTLPEPIATQILDIGVMRGPGTAVKMLQRVLNLAGFGPMAVDGVLGPATRDATMAALQQMGNYLNNAIVDERIKFYENIVANDPRQARFINGWRNRAERFRLPV